MEKKKKINPSGPLKDVADYIAKSQLSGYDAIILSNWLLSAFVNQNISLLPHYDEDDNNQTNE